MTITISTGSVNVPGLWTTYIIRKAVPGLKSNLLFADYARPAMIPKGVGGYIGRWLVPTMRRGSTTALSQTAAVPTAPTENMVTISSVEATIADYGEWFPTSDLAQQSQISEALDIYADVIGYAGATCIEDLIYNEGCGTASASLGFANYFSSHDTTINGGNLLLNQGDTLILPDLVYAAQFLRANDAVGFPSLGGDYMVAIHPNQETGMITDVTTLRLSWATQNQYTPNGFKQLVDNNKFVGRWNGTTILRTTTVRSTAYTTFAYKTMMLADWGVGWLGLGETGPKAPQIIRKDPGPSSTNDPLNIYHTLGWKVRAVARVLDRNSRGLIIYSAQS